MEARADKGQTKERKVQDVVRRRHPLKVSSRIVQMKQKGRRRIASILSTEGKEEGEHRFIHIAKCRAADANANSLLSSQTQNHLVEVVVMKTTKM